MQFSNRRATAAYVLIVFLVALMTGCGGGGQSSADKKAAVTVTQVQIFPNPSISLTPGQVTQVFAQALNANNGQVFTQTITFNSSAQNDPNPIQISNGGLLCAGKWDSLTAPVVCTPDTAPATSNITAAAGGVTSPTTVANVHVAIASIVVTPQVTPPLAVIPPCVNEAKTQIYTATAKDSLGNPIPNVGTFNWQSTQTGVATIPSTGDSGFTNQATATAVHPGDSNILASIGTVTPITSTPVAFEQCLVKSILVTVGTPNAGLSPPEDISHFTVATGATRALTVQVTDSTNTVLTTLPTLNWNTTQPSIAAVGGTGSVSGVAPGTVGISASCLPNNCNIGTNVVVTSNLVSGTVTGTPGTSATAYVTCKDPTPAGACNTGTAAAPQVKLFPISGTTLGTAITLPHTPNSMMINQQNSRIFIGSTPDTNDLSAGLMVVDANANTLSSTVVNAPGKVLTVAPNGNAVVVSNDADVFLYNGSTVTTLLNGTTHVTNAKAAAFSPDSGKLIVATSTGLVWFEVSGLTPTSQSPGGSFVGAAFLPSGSLQAASAFGTTQLFGIDPANTSAGSVGCGGLIQPLPNVDAMYAADPAGGTVCVIDNTPTANSFSIGAFTANNVLIDPTGALAYLVGGSSSVKINTIGSTTVTTIGLFGGETATTGGIATNGTVYVGHSNGTASGTVHVISAGLAGTDSATPIATTIPADLVVAKH